MCQSSKFGADHDNEGSKHFSKKMEICTILKIVMRILEIDKLGNNLEIMQIHQKWRLKVQGGVTLGCVNYYVPSCIYMYLTCIVVAFFMVAEGGPVDREDTRKKKSHEIRLAVETFHFIWLAYPFLHRIYN